MTVAPPALIEIVERNQPAYDPDRPATGFVKPNEFRINGHPVAVAICPITGDPEFEVHSDRDDALRVTVTLYARRIVFGAEEVDVIDGEVVE